MYICYFEVEYHNFLIDHHKYLHISNKKILLQMNEQWHSKQVITCVMLIKVERDGGIFMQSIQSRQDWQEHREQAMALAVLYGSPTCSTCQALKPRLQAFLSEQFPKIQQIYLDTQEWPEIAAEQSIFTLPVLQIYLEGKLFWQWARAFGLNEVQTALERPYALLFD